MKNPGWKIFSLFLLAALLSACAAPAVMPAAARVRLTGQPLCLQPGALVCAWESKAVRARQSSLLIQLGAHFSEAQVYPQAAGAFILAARGQPSSEGWLKIGRFFWSQGRLDAAAAAFMRIPPYSLTPEQTEALVEWQVRVQDLTGARRTLHLLQGVFPPGKTACLAGYLSLFDDPRSSLEEWKQAGAGEPCRRNFTAWQAALQEQPAFGDDAYQWVRLGILLSSDERWVLAASAFERALQVNPIYADAWACLAEARAQLGEPSWPVLQRAYELDPRSRTVLLALAAYFRRTGQPLRAVEVLLKLAETDPEGQDVLTELASSAAEAGDMTQAVNLLRRAMELHPDDPRVNLAAARFSARYEVEIVALGLPAAWRALELLPDDPAVLEVNGWLEWLGGSFDLAEQHLISALTFSPLSPTVHLRLGQLYLTTGRQDQARKYLLNALRLAPGENPGQTAARLLQRYFPACPFCP